MGRCGRSRRPTIALSPNRCTDSSGSNPRWPRSATSIDIFRACLRWEKGVEQHNRGSRPTKHVQRTQYSEKNVLKYWLKNKSAGPRRTQSRYSISLRVMWATCENKSIVLQKKETAFLVLSLTSYHQSVGYFGGDKAKGQNVQCWVLFEDVLLAFAGNYVSRHDDQRERNGWRDDAGSLWHQKNALVRLNRV